MLQSITISAAKTETVTNELMRLIYAYSSSFFLSRYLMVTSSNKLHWQESEGYRTNVL